MSGTIDGILQEEKIDFAHKIDQKPSFLRKNATSAHYLGGFCNYKQYFCTFLKPSHDRNPTAYRSRHRRVRNCVRHYDVRAEYPCKEDH
jgi:hypothetical protein